MKLFTTVMMCLWIVSSTHAYEKDHLVYEVISEDEATVSVRANTEEFNETSLVVPDKIEIDGKTYTVTETPFMAFGRLESLVDIELPKTLKVLGQQTFFECDNLKEVYVHDGCVLEPFVFRASMKLEKVHLPEDLTVIPDGTFSYCRSLTDVNIPSALEQISWYAFSGCWKLKHITLPPTLKSLGKGAFKYCLALQEINVPQSVTTLMPEAFGGCISLEKANIPDNITIIDDALFDSCLVLKSIVIPENVTEIRTAAFRDCKALTQITIPQHVGFIYQEAFAGCNALQLIISQPAVPPIIWEVCRRCEQEGWNELPLPSLYPRKHRELLRAIVSVKLGISYYKINLKALDAAYSIAFPKSTPLNVNKKKRIKD